MKERPILFTEAMVRALVGGRKTQTRRLMNPQPAEWVTTIGKDCFCTSPQEFSARGRHPVLGPASNFHKCPWGVSGDQLWVRENWAVKDCGSRVSMKPEAWPKGFPLKRVQYTATDKAPAEDKNENPYWWNKRPSLHMPRWASRLSLEVISIRAERIQDITEEDAIAEGMVKGECGWSWDPEFTKSHENSWGSAKIAFETLINVLHTGKNWSQYYAYPNEFPVPLFEQNPWVWVIEFKNITGKEPVVNKRNGSAQKTKERSDGDFKATNKELPQHQQR